MHPMLNIAVAASRRAATVIMRYINRLESLDIQSKGRNDFVSEVDRLAENEIIKVLQTAYPDHAILAEESGLSGDSEYQWIIDPLDGTTNFLHGYPQFGISIALKHKGKLVQAVVHDPLRDEIFTASRGQGAQLNDRRIRISKVTTLDNALLGTGFPFKSQHHLETWINTFRALFTRSSGVRRAGSAALDLAHVASGRLDGFWEFGLKPWDMAAGCLLIQEAGGLTGDFYGKQDFLESGNLIAGNPKIYEEILQIITPHVTAS